MGLSSSAAFVAYNLTLPAEGLVTTTYKDPIGLATICVGHMDRNLKVGETKTIEECMELYAKDWKDHQSSLDKVVKQGYSSEWQRAALTSFTFNVGIGSVKSSTLIKLINNKEYDEACNQLVRWVYAGGKKLNGLVTRRGNEQQVCLGNLSYKQHKEYEIFLREWNSEKIK